MKVKMVMDDGVVKKANMRVVWEMELELGEESATRRCESGNREELL